MQGMLNSRREKGMLFSQDRGHVLFVQQGGGMSGSSRSLYQLVMELSQQGFNCRVLLGQSGVLREWLEQQGIPVEVAPLACFTYGAHNPFRVGMLLRFLYTLPRNLWILPKLFRKLSLDAIYLNTSVLIGPALAARLAGVPVVWHIREWLGDDVLAFLNCRVISRLAALVIANSDFVAGQFAGLGAVRRVYNAVDMTEFDPTRFCKEQVRRELGLDPAQPVAGMLSVIARPKGHWVLLDAAPEILRHCPHAVFLIIGGATLSEGYDRTWRARLRRALGQRYDQAQAFREDVERAGLMSHFRFLGFQEDIPHFLTAMDVLVFPPIAPEGFGRPLIEAGAMEVPVVASRLGPHPEIVVDGETGLLVPPNDPDALAGAILKLLDDPSRARRMGQAARHRVAELFNLEQYVDGVEQVIERVLASGEQVARTTG